MSDRRVLSLLSKARVASSVRKHPTGITLKFIPASLKLECRIVEQVLSLPPGSKSQWRASKKLWLERGWCRQCRDLNEPWLNACPDCDYAVWGDGRSFVESGRYHYAFMDNPHGWPEMSVASPLLTSGFSCWTGIHLFARGPEGARQRDHRNSIEELFRARDWLIPRAVQAAVNAACEGEGCTFKNPDVVAYHAGRNEWQFIEAKDVRDRKEGQERDQVLGLAILHLITGAHVGLTRVNDTGMPSQREKRLHSYTFDLAPRA